MLKLFSFFKLIRYPNLILLFCSQFFVVLLLVFKFSYVFEYQYFLIALITCFTAAAGYIINDCYDVQIDYINKQTDSIFVDKDFKRSHLLIFYGLFNVLALTISYLISLKLTIIVLLIIFALWFYSYKLKKSFLVGNIVIAFLSSLAVCFPLFVNFKFNQLVFIYALFSFFLHLMREIIKDIEDIEGDSINYSHTVPIEIGIQNTKFFVRTLIYMFLLFIGIIVLSAKYQIFMYVSPILIGLSIFILHKLNTADQNVHFKSISSLLKIEMAVGVLTIPLNIFL